MKAPHPPPPSAARREHRLRRRPLRGRGGAGFGLRGLKGLWWEPEQYLSWPDFLADAGYDFFMLCYTLFEFNFIYDDYVWRVLSRKY